MSTTDGTTRFGRKYKILIVDDHPVTRQGLAWLLGQEPDLEVLEGADNASEAIQQIRSMRPDLVVVDISLRDSQGIELIASVRTFDQAVKMLVWSSFEEKVYAERALRAGAMGYVNKQESGQAVIGAVRCVLEGGMYLSAKMTKSLLERITGGQSLAEDPVANLSDRELEAFQMIGRGMTAREIARHLGLKPRTVETLRERIKAKLALSSAAELNCAAARWVLENG